uniref:flippase n=1 Tax=Streptococcus pluranimalium TaxID=82348 RepID=UPI003F68EA71
MSSLKKNVLYNLLYQFLLMAIPLVTTPYLSRVLGATGIGQYSYIYAVANYFVLFAMLGVNNYGNRTIAMSKRNKIEMSKNFWSIYFSQLFISVIVILFYFFYSYIWSSDRILSLVASLFVISSALDINWFFFGIENFKVTVTRNMTIKLLTLIAVLLFVKDKNDIVLYTTINVVGIFISQIVLWLFLKKHIVWIKPRIFDIIIHVKPNLKLFIPVLAISLYKLMDKVMLAQMTDLQQVGFFETSEKIIQIPLAVVTSIGTVMLPKMSSLAIQKNRKESEKYIENSLYLIIFIISGVVFGIMAVSKEFVPLFYGAGYEANVSLFHILLPSCIFLSIANVVRTQILIPQEKDNIYIQSTIIGAILNVIINYLLIPNFFAIGAAIGTLVAEISVCVYQVIRVASDHPVVLYLKKSSPFLIFGLLMYCIISNLEFHSQIMSLYLKVVLGSLLYMSISGSWLYYLFKNRKENK